tara:strand:+ start:583 stop:708 length:126 start_codon:yes stop_codon:yes gene_type:complete
MLEINNVWMHRKRSNFLHNKTLARLGKEGFEAMAASPIKPN